MAAEGAGQLGVIYKQIMAGDPKSFTTAGDEFKQALDALNKVEGEIPTAVSNLVGANWKGPASKAFTDAADKIVELIRDTATAVGNPSWKTALDTAKTALEKAQEDIQALSKNWNDNVGKGIKNDVGAFGSAAEEILRILSAAYDTQRKAMKPVKDIDDPKDGESKDGESKDGESKDGESKDGEPKDGEPKDGESKDGGPKDGESKDGGPNDGGPKDGGPNDGGPKDGGPKDGGFESLESNDPEGGSPVPDGDSGPKPPAVGPSNENLTNEPGPGAPDAPPSKDSPFAPKAPDTSNFEGPPKDQPPVLGKPGNHDPYTTLSSASNPGGALPPGGPLSGGAPSSGIGPPSQLTSAGPSAGLVGSTGHGLFLAGAGARGPVGLVGPGVAPIGNRGRGDDEDEDRETELLGDEEWDDAAHLPTASIGRPE
jgi:uncharacterized protein YukE